MVQQKESCDTLLEPLSTEFGIQRNHNAALLGTLTVIGKAAWMMEKALQVMCFLLGLELFHGVQRSKQLQFFPLQR